MNGTQEQINTDTIRRRGLTVLIVSEHDAKMMSARFALRCVVRDLRFVFRALGHHALRYFNTFCEGHRHAACWWTRDQDRHD